MNRRDAYGLGAALILALAGAAQAQVVRTQPGFGGFDSGDVCYQWSGGHGSAGAFSRCQPSVQIAVLTPAPLAAPPTANPVMVPMQSCPPLPTPKHRPIVKRKPRVQC